MPRRDSIPLTSWGSQRQPLADFAERATSDLAADTAHTILSGTVKANALIDQRHLLRFKITGQASHATSGLVTPSLKIGTTTVLTGPALTVGSSETPFVVEGEFGISPIGSNGEIVGTLECRQDTSVGALVALDRADNKAFDTSVDNDVTVVLTTGAGVTLEILSGICDLVK